MIGKSTSVISAENHTQDPEIIHGRSVQRKTENRDVAIGAI